MKIEATPKLDTLLAKLCQEGAITRLDTTASPQEILRSLGREDLAQAVEGRSSEAPGSPLRVEQGESTSREGGRA